jgi:hypothetical protein
MRTITYKKPFIDVLQNVFGGVHILTEDQTSSVDDTDLRARPWLSGLTMSDVHVRLSREDDPRDEEPPKR